MAQSYRERDTGESAASQFFKKVLNLTPNSNGLKFEDVEAFSVLPKVMALRGTTTTKLIEDATALCADSVTDLAVYHTLGAINLLARMHLIRTDGEAIYPTQKGLDFFSFIENGAEVERWMSSQRTDAQASGANIYRFDANADKVRDIIGNMVSLKNNTLKQAARE